MHSHNTVITIPENLPLTDSEKSVLSKGLNFDPITKRTNEFSIKQDLEKFLRRVQLKAFFHDKEDDSDTSNKDIFETLLVRKSKWTPPEGQFASLDFFTKKWRHDIHKLKFNRNTKFSNLSSEEWAALKNLSKRNENQRRWASSSKNVAILSLWSKQAIIAPNNLIGSHHYKRHKKIRMTEFHSPSLSILIITQSKASFLVILNYSKMIPRLVVSFRNLHLFHSNATKT